MAGTKTKIVPLTDKATGFAFKISASQIVGFYGTNSGADSIIQYIARSGGPVVTQTVDETPATINTAAAKTFSITLSTGETYYIHADRIVYMFDMTSYRQIGYYNGQNVLQQLSSSTAIATINTAAGNTFSVTTIDGVTRYLNCNLVADIATESAAREATLSIDFAVDAFIIDAAGTGYTTPPLVEIEGTGAGAAGTASLGVLSGVPSAAGSGYAAGDTITLAGGTSTTAGVCAVASTKLVSAAVNAAGTNYAPADTITLAGGTHSVSAVLTVLTVGGSGEVATFSISIAGTYTVNTTSFTQASTSGSGSGATFNTALFGVKTLTVFDAGVYSVIPSNPVAQASTTGSGTGATITAVWCVSDISLDSGGVDYTEQPTVTLTGGGGTGATAHATMELSAINVIEGGVGYGSAPTITITGDGSGATATASVADGRVISVSLTAAGSDYTTAGYTLSGGSGSRVMYNEMKTSYTELKVTATPSTLQTAINAL